MFGGRGVDHGHQRSDPDRGTAEELSNAHVKRAHRGAGGRGAGIRFRSTRKVASAERSSKLLSDTELKAYLTVVAAVPVLPVEGAAAAVGVTSWSCAVGTAPSPLGA